MSAASYEMSELLREVQKLQKELQPVRSAVTALQKRESETPNPAAAGASLHKVAARLEAVRHRYTPYLHRLQELISDEVPALLQQTQVLGLGDDAVDAATAATQGDAGRGATAAKTTIAAADAASLSYKRSGPTDAAARGAHTQGNDEGPARLLREVCPAVTPHLLRPANVRFTQQQLRLRAEMVEYLIATDRLDIADHVARAYELPLQWFPCLVALHRERTYGATLQGGVAGSEVHGPAGGLRSGTPTASPLITPATRPRGGGAPPQSPMQLPSSAAPPRANSVTSTPTVVARSPAARAASFSSEPLTGLPPAVRPPLQQRSVTSPSAGPSPANGSWLTEDKMDATADAPAPLMPDLVARVVSAAMYLKDDYFDRMVLERVLEQSVGLAPSLDSDAAAGGASSLASRTEDSPLSAAEQHRACVLSRIAHLPLSHLHTQSGDPVFDSAMMNVIEELLVYGLQRWAEDDTATFDSAADAQRGVMAAEVLAAETKKRKADLLRTLTTDALLTAEEMLLADKVWSEDILFLKRPTRFYCVETGLSSDESAGVTGAAPRARTTGEIVSQLVAEAQNSPEATTGIFVT